MLVGVSLEGERQGPRDRHDDGLEPVFRDEALSQSGPDHQALHDSAEGPVLHDEALSQSGHEDDVAPDPAEEADLLDAAPGTEPDRPAPLPPVAVGGPVGSAAPPARPKLKIVLPKKRVPIVRREPVTGAEPAAVTCAACGASNVYTALACGRCGADVAPAIPDVRGALGAMAVGSPLLLRNAAPAAPPDASAAADPFAVLPPDVRARMIAERDGRAAHKVRLGERQARAVRRLVVLTALGAALLGAVVTWVLVHGVAAIAVCAAIDAALGAAVALGVVRASAGRGLTGALLGGGAGLASGCAKAAAVVATGGALLSLLPFAALLLQLYVAIKATELLSTSVEGSVFDGGLLEKLG